MTKKKKIIFRVVDSDDVQNNNIKEIEKNIGDSNQFTIITYTPGSINVGMPSLYSNKLFLKEENVKIDEVFFNNVKNAKFNGEQYDAISVYYSQGKVSLLVKFEKGSKNEWFVRKDEVGIYWKYESFGYEEDNLLENKLKEIECSIKNKISYLLDKKKDYSNFLVVSNDEHSSIDEFTKYTHTPKDKKWEKSFLLYKGDPLKRMNLDKFEAITELEGQSYEKVTVYFGNKLKNESNDQPLIVKLISTKGNTINYYANKIHNLSSYWEKIKVLSSGTEDKHFVDQLKNTQFDLFQSVLLLIDKCKSEQYYDNQITNTKTNRKINSVGGKNIKVKICDKYSYLKSLNFKVYEHDISESVKSYNHVSETIFGLRFFIHNNEGNYEDLKLYNYKNIDIVNREYIYYEKNQNILYVFFYGNDPRPLLICYNNKAFQPHSLDNYFTKWVKVTNLDNLILAGGNNQKLLETLMEINYIMNPVNINQSLEKNVESSTYVIHEFYSSNKTEVKISLTSKDLKFFRRYTHKPTSGYILGEISHNGSNIFTSYDEYNNSIGHKNKFPRSVDVYYYLYDSKNDFPLMIVLEYEEGNTDHSTSNKEYFKFTSKDSINKLTKIDSKDDTQDKVFLEKIRQLEDEIKKLSSQTKGVQEAKSQDQQSQSNKEQELNDVVEEKLKQIRENLNIDYRESENNNAAVAGTLTTLGLAGTGGGFLYYKYQSIIIPFIRSLFH